MKNKWLQRLPVFLGILYGIFYLNSIYRYLVFFKLDKLLSSVALLLSIFIPLTISKFANKRGIKLSPLFHIIFLSFIFASSYLGTVCDYYIIYFWWDILLHGSFGVFCTLLGVYLIRIFTIKQVIGYITSPLLIAFITSCFSITSTSLWEIFEYLSDVILKSNMTDHLSLDDTMNDIIMGTLGSLVFCIIYYLISKKGGHKKFQGIS